MLKKMISWLQQLDAVVNDPGFRIGVLTGAAVTATAVNLLWVVLS